jgi:hypothetical protein
VFFVLRGDGVEHETDVWSTGTRAGVGERCVGLPHTLAWPPTHPGEAANDGERLWAVPPTSGLPGLRRRSLSQQARPRSQRRHKVLPDSKQVDKVHWLARSIRSPFSPSTCSVPIVRRVVRSRTPAHRTRLAALTSSGLECRCLLPAPARVCPRLSTRHLAVSWPHSALVASSDSDSGRLPSGHVADVRSLLHRVQLVMEQSSMVARK